MWKETDKGLYKEFILKDFKAAHEFIGQVARVAERYQHHPLIENNGNVVRIWLRTDDEDKQIITDQDREMSVEIDLGQPKTAQPSNFQSAQAIKIYADGGSRGNPGPSASGYVLLDMTDRVLVEKGIYLGVTTNNQAEYHALKFALEEASTLHPKEVHVFMDSLLVVNQMLGKFKVKNRDLWPIHQAISELTHNFHTITFTHVPRELNKLADRLVNQALDKALEL